MAMVRLQKKFQFSVFVADFNSSFIVSRDGRPGSQQVTEEFLVDWGSYMSSRNDVVYVKLDVAGARGLPRALLRGRLGGVEVADQLAVIR